MASAHVAGVAALLWAAFPDATVPQVRKALLDSGKEVSGVEYGRIDAAKALEALDQEIAGGHGALQLSRHALAVEAKPGRVPREQTGSIISQRRGGQQRGAQADAP